MEHDNPRMQRYFLYFSYDGTKYHGWQLQPNGISVQAVLQQALTTLLRTPIEVVGAGRTDTGVHARLMVAHFDFAGEMDTEQVVYRLNRMLPKDISVQKLVPVDGDMHARFSAKWRTYRYYIHTAKSPFLRHYSLLVTFPLDFKQMNEGCKLLLAQRDFAAFCKSGGDNKTTLCEVTTCQWVQTAAHEWYFEITANRFLRNMVRATVGTLMLLGRHKISLSEFQRILTDGNRSQAGESMPGHALFLEDIVY